MMAAVLTSCPDSSGCSCRSRYRVFTCGKTESASEESEAPPGDCAQELAARTRHTAASHKVFMICPFAAIMFANYSLFRNAYLTTNKHDSDGPKESTAISSTLNPARHLILIHTYMPLERGAGFEFTPAVPSTRT